MIHKKQRLEPAPFPGQKRFLIYRSSAFPVFFSCHILTDPHKGLYEQSVWVLPQVG